MQGLQAPGDDRRCAIAADPMAIDHVTLVTMTDEGRSLVNLRLEGILDKSGHAPRNGEELCFQASRCKRAAAE